MAKASVGARLPAWKAWSLGLAVACAGTGLHAAEITVAAGSQYFANWAFSSINPDGKPEELNLPSGQTVNGTLDGKPLAWSVITAVASDDAGIMSDGYNAFGTSLPSDIGISNAWSSPATGQGFLSKGHAAFSSATPWRSGTTFFFQDVDNGEAASFRFYDCAGNQVDAGDFDFLKISTTNTPIHSLQGAAPARYWQVSAPAPNDSNTVNGIIIRSAEVCKVDIQGTRPANGGSINYFMGVLANVVPVAVPAVTGTTTVGSTVTGSYTYSDSESDPEDTTAGGTQYKFVTSPNASIASSADGTTVASGATGGAGASVTYTLQSGDRNQYLFYCVTPAAASGASPGLEVCTPATGPVTDKPAPPVTTTPQPVPSLSAFSAAGLGALMLALFGWVGRRRAGRH